jgi:hypothetical protein
MSIETPVSLLDRLRVTQEADAWNRFVELYTPLIYFWSKKLGVPTSDISDFVQEVFAVLVRELPRFPYRTGCSISRLVVDAADELGMTVNSIPIARSRVLSKLRSELVGPLD